MITAAENTTAASTTQRACAIISHTSEFFWYALYISVLPFPGNPALGSEAARLKVLVIVVAVVAAVLIVVVMAKRF